MVALLAAFTFVKRRSVVFGVAEIAQRCLVDLHGHLAVLAEAAREALRNDADRGVRHQEWLNAHFFETREGTGRVVRVQGREDQMAGERGFDGNLSRFLVTRFTDENDVRILAEECAKDSGKIEPDVFVRLNLAEAREIVFNRVLGGRDVDLR